MSPLKKASIKTLAKCLLAILATVSCLAENADIISHSPRLFSDKDTRPLKPKVQPAFTPLPIGQVRPTGWLLDWAKDARNGLTGHLDEHSPTFSNAWKGFHFKAQGVETNGTGWPLEQCSYWLDGLVRLAFLLDDKYLIEKATSRLDLVVDGVLKGGDSLIYWQPKSILDNEFNSWAHSHMGRALVAYYQATGNPRVLEALQRVYRDYPLADMPPDTFGCFKGVSGAVNLDAMLETYNLGGDQRILDQALAFAARKPFKALVKQWNKSEIPQGHTVIYYENARVPALLYPWTGNAQMLQATERILEQGDRHHGLPMGVCSGEEFMAGVGSTRHVETCDVAAAQWTFNWLLRITGDRKYADRIERIFFNAGSSPVDQNFEKMSYFQSLNRVESLLPGERAFGGGYDYSPLGGGAYCCPGNLCRILPNYIMYMWMATPDHGLAATLYGPCSIKTTVADKIPVSIDCRTAYPFEEAVRMDVEPKTSATFPLYLRIPGWSKAPVIMVNDEPFSVRLGQNGFVKIARRWNPGDRIVLKLPMAIRVEEGSETPFPQIEYFKKESIYKRGSAQLTDVKNPYACVYFGPLLFALPIPDKTPNKQVGKTPFNFALEADDAQLAEKIKVQRAAMPQPWKWRWDKSPIQLHIPARQFDWTPTALQPLPKAPIEDGVPASVSLVPYGCTKFRISMFPVAKALVENAPPPSKDGQYSARILENKHLSLTVSEQTGAMIRLENKLTGEVYTITGDEFAVNTTERQFAFSDAKLASLAQEGGKVTARYEHPKLNIEVAYSLGEQRAFIEKKMQVTFKEACGLKELVVSKPTFSADGLRTVCYRYPNFDIVAAMVKSWHGWDFRRPPNSEPVRTFFGRTTKGGFFTGVEMAYDASTLKDSTVSLCYAPSLKIKAGQKLDGETMYLGVYRRSSQEDRQENSWEAVESLWLTPKKEGFDGAAAAGVGGKGAAAKKEIKVAKPDVMPLPAEFQALSAMVTSVFGPARHGLKAYACGYHCQMQLDGYDSEPELQADLKALEFFKECGLDGFSGSAPWGGETKKMNALREGDRFQMDESNRRLLQRAKELGLEVTQWPTMNNTHPWDKLGGPLRLDRPEWLRVVQGKPSLRGDVMNFQQQFANCFAYQPFYNWLEQLIGDTLATGFYKSWCMD
ncbi:MAG: glycoside hydrolase family 127 protein, partial [Methylococcaceae bacterium]|nr:glycoside hydrolase family 127 protein [Methylococcaceae bacterium]